MAYPNQSAASAAHDGVADATASVAQKTGDAAKQMSREVSDAACHAADVAHHQLDSMTAYVRKNPLQATAIAAGVGFVFALIARR